MKPNKVVDVMTLIVIVAGITTLTRPQSQGPALVKALSDGFVGALSAATSWGGTSGQPTGSAASFV